MAEPTTTETTTTPPATPPAETATPPVTPPVTPPATPPVTPAVIAKPPEEGDDKDFIRMPRAKVKRRIERKAEELVMATLGVPLAEAKEILAKRAAGTPQEPGQAIPADVEAQLKRIPKLEQENNEKDQLIERQNARIAKIKSRHSAQVMELRLQNAATSVGVIPDEIDYALSLYAKKVESLKDGEDAPQAPAFFAGLKKTKPYLFSDFDGKKPAPPDPVSVKPTTAPAESTQPGEDKPTPGGTGVRPTTPPNAMKMDEKQLREHQRRAYGFVPGN